MTHFYVGFRVAGKNLRSHCAKTSQSSRPLEHCRPCRALLHEGLGFHDRGASLARLHCTSFYFILFYFSFSMLVQLASEHRLCDCSHESNTLIFFICSSQVTGQSLHVGFKNAKEWF